MDKPLVSIITPCYNGEFFLDRYFESILAQTYPNLELIFVNDGSTDKTEEIAMSYKGKLCKKGIQYIYIKQDNAGQAAALNKGLKIFKGKYLTWPDSDDEMTRDCIEKKVEFLENHIEYEMVRSNGIYYNEETETKEKIGNFNEKRKENLFEDLLLLRTYGCCGCYMITKKLFEMVYPTKTIFESRYGQNWQILVPAASRSKCGFVDEELYIVYEHKDSHSRNKRTLEQEIDRWDGFTEILLNAIEYSACNQKKYVSMVKENCARNQFYYAISLGDKNIIKAKYAEIKKYGKLTFKELGLFVKYVYLQ